jgi:peroxiredoxin
MLQMKKLLFVILILFAFTEISAQVKKGKQAPEISLKDISGQTISLSSFKGKVVLIDFWASWCMPCRKNNPNLVALYKKFKEEGFEILGVSIDKDNADWKTAIEKDKLTWTQVVDNAGWNAQSTIDYGIEGIPASFLVDQEGIIRGVDLDGRELESMIKKLLTAKK